MASLLDLPATAELVLSLFVTHLEDLDVDIPARRYVAPGSMVPWDGEQLVVNLQSIDQGQPGQPIGTTQTAATVVLAAQFGVGLLREVPMLHGEGPINAMVPDSGEMNAAGLVSMGDVAALTRAALAIQTDNELVGPGEGIVIGPVTPLGPEGGLAGHRLILSVSLT